MKRIFIILIVLAVAAVCFLAASGVLTYQGTPDKSSVILDKSQLKEKTRDFFDRSKEAGGKSLEKAGEDLKRAGDKLRSPSPPSNPAPSNPPSAPAPERPASRPNPPDRDT